MRGGRTLSWSRTQFHDDFTRRTRGFAVTATIFLASILIGTVTQLAPALFSEEQWGLDGYQIIWPQRWEFFTNLTGRQYIVAYKVLPSEMTMTPITQRQVWDEGLGGLNRVDAAKALGTAQLARDIPDQFWQTCSESDPTGCSRQLNMTKSYQVKNFSGLRSLCGKVVLAVENGTLVTPRGFSEEPQGVHRMAVVDLTCAN
jgi:sporulation delaying protein SdpA